MTVLLLYRHLAKLKAIYYYHHSHWRNHTQQYVGRGWRDFSSISSEVNPIKKILVANRGIDFFKLFIILYVCF